MKGSRLLAGVGSGVFIAIGVAAGGVPATSGCTTHQCDSDLVCIDSTGSMKTIINASDCTPVITGGTKLPFYNLSVGDFVSDNGDEQIVWDTSSFLGPWLDFPGQRTYIIQYPPGFAGHVPTGVWPWVSSDNDAGVDVSHSNWTPASGQLFEVTNTESTQLTVLNATCVDYGLRIEFQADLPKASAGDASSSPDAAVSSDTADAGATE